ncbi:MAG: hypothetical protein ACLGJB_11390 [Blastocatellia bacterium]
MKRDRRPADESGDAAIAAINIGPREQLKRRVLGIVSLVIGSGVAFLMIAYDTARPFRLVIFFPLWVAGLGLFQAREKT